MAEILSLKSGKLSNNNDPWAVLVALATIIIVASLISIVAICILWKRYKYARMLFERNLVGISFDMPRPESQSKEYEVQSLDMYVPQDDREDLGEVHISLSPTTGIQSVHQVKEVSSADLPPLNDNFLDNSLDSIQTISAENNLQDDNLFKRVMHYSKLNK